MCVDHSPPAGGPAVLHDTGPVPQVVLEPVDAVEITALMDNVTDIFMPDQGPARADQGERDHDGWPGARRAPRRARVLPARRRAPGREHPPAAVRRGRQPGWG